MKFRVFVLGLTAIVLVLLSIGAAGAYWIAANRPTVALERLQRTEPIATAIIPWQSPIVVSLLANPDQLEVAELSQAPASQRPAIRATFDRFRQTLQKQTTLNYGRDIQPWLGNEITLAITSPDLDRDEENGQQLGYLVALAVQDPAQAATSIQSFWKRRAGNGITVTSEPFAGVDIVSGESKARKFSLATAILSDRFVLVGNHPKVLREALNGLQVPELSLSNRPSYETAMQHFSKPQLGLAFINLPEFGSLLSGKAVGMELLSRTYDSLVMSLSPQAQGLLADALLLPVPGKSIATHQPAGAASTAALQHIPASSALALVGPDLAEQVTAWLPELTSYSPLQAIVQPPLETLQQWGVDLQQDLLGWLQDDYALALLPRADRPQADWLLATKATEATTAGLDQFNRKVQQQGISVGRLSLDDQAINAWIKLSTQTLGKALSLNADVQGLQTTVGEDVLFATSLDAMQKAIQATQRSLAQAEDFQAAIAPLHPQNGGYLYLNGPAIQPILARQSTFPLLRTLAASDWWKEVKSIALTTYGGDSQGQSGAVFVRIGE